MTVLFQHGKDPILKYLTFTELREKLGGRSRSAIYVDIENGRLPRPVKLGHRLYWPETEVDAHLAALREGGAHA